MENHIKGNSIWPWVQGVAEFNGALPAGGRWPKISIVTPNYNYAELIETTIRSVLMQGYPNLEYIIIDDGSTDSSVEIIRKYEPMLGYFEHQKNQGQYPAINKGFAHASGDIFGWINSDDIYLPWTLRAVGSIFARYPQVQWIIGNPSRIQDGTIHAVAGLSPYPRDFIRAGLFHGEEGGVGWIQQESCFWRKSLWDKAGGLKETLRFAADYELWTRFAKHADLYAVSSLLGGFSVRGKNNRSIANRKRYMDEVQSVMKAIGESDPTIKQAVRDVTVFHKASRLPIIGGAARRILALNRYCGPILRWDFDQAEYRVAHKPLFR